MNNVDEIINSQEFKNHVFGAAICSFACDPEEGPSLYFEGMSDRPIIYHMTHAKHITTAKDEINIYKIPEFLGNLKNVDESIYNTLMEIYNEYLAVEKEFEYDREYEFNFMEAIKFYGFDNAAEMWSDEDFQALFKEYRQRIEARLQPIQDKVQQL